LPKSEDKMCICSKDATCLDNGQVVYPGK